MTGWKNYHDWKRISYPKWWCSSFPSVCFGGEKCVSFRAYCLSFNQKISWKVARFQWWKLHRIEHPNMSCSWPLCTIAWAIFRCFFFCDQLKSYWKYFPKLNIDVSFPIILQKTMVNGCLKTTERSKSWNHPLRFRPSQKSDSLSKEWCTCKAGSRPVISRVK